MKRTFGAVSIACFAAAGLALVAVADWPYGFYMLVRLAVTAAAGVAAFTFWEPRRPVLHGETMRRETDHTDAEGFTKMVRGPKGHMSDEQGRHLGGATLVFGMGAVLSIFPGALLVDAFPSLKGWPGLIIGFGPPLFFVGLWIRALCQTFRWKL